MGLEMSYYEHGQGGGGSFFCKFWYDFSLPLCTQQSSILTFVLFIVIFVCFSEKSGEYGRVLWMATRVSARKCIS